MSDEIKFIQIQTRTPRGRDPGQVESSYYKVVNDDLFLTNERGTPVDRYKLHKKIPPGVDERTIASILLRQHYSSSPGDFTRRLFYPKIRY